MSIKVIFLHIHREFAQQAIYDNAFEWSFEFPEVLSDSGEFLGFDVVVGNPPYISNKDIAISSKKIYESTYETAYNQYDLYSIFIEKSIQLLKNNGVNSFIVPDSFLARSSFKSIRKHTKSNSYLYKVIHLDNVFTEASVSSCIYFLIKNQAHQEIEYLKSPPNKSWQDNVFIKKTTNYLTDELINSYRILFIDRKSVV